VEYKEEDFLIIQQIIFNSELTVIIINKITIKIE